MVTVGKIKKGWSLLKTGGVKAVLLKLREKANRPEADEIYERWVKEYDTLSEADRLQIRSDISRMSAQPLISVLLPVYNIDEKWLRLCIDSLLKQIYPNWELCIVDDCSDAPHIRSVLEEYAAKDSRIKTLFRDVNGHISAASNSALSIAAGEFVALLDHDDELSEHALYMVAREINMYPSTDMIYSDEDMIDENGNRFTPKFKPDFSFDFLYSLNLITHLAVYRTEVIRKISGFRTGFDGSQDYDLTLRIVENIEPSQIRHIPHILYHWRAIQGSVALDSDEKPYAHERAREAIREHLERKGVKASVIRGYAQYHRVVYDLPQQLTISVFQPAGSGHLIQAGENLEVITVENASAEAFNSAARGATGKVLIFLDGDLEPLTDDWIDQLAGYALQKEIGAAGARILYRSGALRHGGIIHGINDFLGFAHRGQTASLGHMARTSVINNFSAVSGACIAIRREVFDELNGFDAENFPDGLYDADFCLRSGDNGYRIVWTPHVEFISDRETNTEKVITRKNSPAIGFFKEKWKSVIEKDPYYNPNLARSKEDFSVEIPPRLKKPWVN
jgi:O-antigen biosynthesis protein